MKKVAVLVPNINFTGGAETVAKNICSLLHEQYHITLVSLFSSSLKAEDNFSGIKVIHLALEMKSSSLSKFLYSLSKLRFLSGFFF